MTKREQKRFVRELLGSIESDIRKYISTDEIPSSWDGIELREYIYEKALRARANHLLTGQRGRDYRNQITITASL
jgi:hypothetical protein